MPADYENEQDIFGWIESKALRKLLERAFKEVQCPHCKRVVWLEPRRQKRDDTVLDWWCPACERVIPEEAMGFFTEEQMIEYLKELSEERGLF